MDPGKILSFLSNFAQGVARPVVGTGVAGFNDIFKAVGMGSQENKPGVKQLFEFAGGRNIGEGATPDQEMAFIRKANDPGYQLGNLAQTALMAVPETALVKGLPLAGKVGVNAAVGAGASAAGTAGDEAANGNLNAKDIAQSAATGALMGGGLTAGGEAAKYSMNFLKDNVPKAIDAYRALPPEVREGGYIGGGAARTFDEQQLSGKTFVGNDNKPRFEGDDSKATVKAPQPGATLSDVLDHPTLFKDYPQLANTPVEAIGMKNKQLNGGLGKDGTIYVNKDILDNPDKYKQTLLHETQHVIQNIEGLPSGTTAKEGMGAYRQNPGEQEAHAVGNRADLTPDQRANSPIQNTLYPQPSLPVGGEIKPSTQLSPEDMGKLIKTEDPLQAKKIIEPILGSAFADRVAPAIAHQTNKDPNIISNLIDNEIPKHLPTPGPMIPPDTQPLSSPAPGASSVKSPFSETSKPGTPTDPVTPQGTRERGVFTSVKESPSLSPELKGTIDQNYNTQYRQLSNQRTINKTGTLLDQGLDKATQTVDESLNKPLGAVSAQDKANALAVMRAYDQMGSHDKAAAIAAKLAEHSTFQGQANQVLATLDTLSPEGLRLWTAKTLKNNGIEATGDLKTNLNAAFDALNKTQDGTLEHTVAAGKIQQMVEGAKPSSIGDKAFATWRAGLLTGPQTVAKIVTSHMVQAVLENVKDIPGAAVDKFMSTFTGQRSLVASLKGSGEGTGRGVGAGKTLLTTGVDINPGSNAIEMRNQVTFGNSVPGKIMNAYVNGVGRIHGSLYKPFFGAAHLQSLYNQAQAAAKTAGLKGEEANSFVTQFVHSPSAQALDVAQHDAEMATFQNTTKLGEVASAIQKKGGLVGKVIAPFTRIPSAIVTDVINYSPVGAVKSIIDAAKDARDGGLSLEGQRALSQGMGRAITGTGAIALGLTLYNKGILTLGYPADAKEQQLWQAEGKQPNAILVNGQWRQLGALGPIGSVLQIGGNVADSLFQGKDFGSAMLQGFTGGLQAVTQQSYLEGADTLLKAIQNPQQYAGAEAKQVMGSVVPTALNTLAASTDQYQRDTTGNNALESGLNAIKERIPGLRETLAPKEDAFGGSVKSGETGLERVIDPFQSSTAATPTPLMSELRRLENAGWGEMPTAITKSMNFGTSRQPEKATLTREQMGQLTKIIGMLTQQGWDKAIQAPAYQNMSDDQKQLLLKSVYSSTSRTGKNLFARYYQLGPYSPDVLKTIMQSKQKRTQVL